MTKHAKVDQSVFEILLPRLKEQRYEVDELAREVSHTIGKTKQHAADVVAERRRRLRRACEELEACESREHADCSGYRRVVQQREHELQRSLQGMRLIEEAASVYQRAQDSHRDHVDTLITEGQKFVRDAAERTRGYQKASGVSAAATVLFGSSVGGSTASGITGAGLSGAGTVAGIVGGGGGSGGLSGVISSPGLPHGFALVPLTTIVLANEVQGPADFDAGQNLADLRWAVRALLDVVLPAASSVPEARSYLAARDAREGLSGPRSYVATYEGFFGDTAIRLSPLPDGTFDVVNGRHRIWLLREEYAQMVPARIAGLR